MTMIGLSMFSKLINGAIKGCKGGRVQVPGIKITTGLASNIPLIPGLPLFRLGIDFL